MKTKIENRGGKRANAGRKKTTEETERINIYLSDFIQVTKLAESLNMPKVKALQVIIWHYFELSVDKSNKGV